MFLLLNILLFSLCTSLPGMGALHIPQLLAFIWVLQRGCSEEKYCFMSEVK